MKILISDKMSDKVEDVLKSKQIDYDIKTGMSPEELKSVIDQCLKSRSGETPVLIARQVGRENQSKKFVTLKTLPFKEIDMLSIIIIGNSQTTLDDEIFLTPRGYLQN